jgi:hypothetical protein
VGAPIDRSTVHCQSKQGERSVLSTHARDLVLSETLICVRDSIHAGKPLSPKEVLCTTMKSHARSRALWSALPRFPSGNEPRCLRPDRNQVEKTGVVSRDVCAQALPEPRLR